MKARVGQMLSHDRTIPPKIYKCELFYFLKVRVIQWTQKDLNKS